MGYHWADLSWERDIDQEAFKNNAFAKEEVNDEQDINNVPE